MMMTPSNKRCEKTFRFAPLKFKIKSSTADIWACPVTTIKYSIIRHYVLVKQPLSGWAPAFISVQHKKNTKTANGQTTFPYFKCL